MLSYISLHQNHSAEAVLGFNYAVESSKIFGTLFHMNTGIVDILTRHGKTGEAKHLYHLDR